MKFLAGNRAANDWSLFKHTDLQAPQAEIAGRCEAVMSGSNDDYVESFVITLLNLTINESCCADAVKGSRMINTKTAAQTAARNLPVRISASLLNVSKDLYYVKIKK